MGVIGYDPYPPAVDAAGRGRAEADQGRLVRSAQPAGRRRHLRLPAIDAGWTAEQLCLAYALTEPARGHRAGAGRATSSTWPAWPTVPERDLPPAVSAQIEMARFSAERDRARTALQRRSA